MHVQATAGTLVGSVFAAVASYYIQYKVTKQIAKSTAEEVAQAEKDNKREDDKLSLILFLTYTLVGAALVAAYVLSSAP